MKKLLILLALAALVLSMGCQSYYDAQVKVHETWAQNPRVAEVSLKSADGGAIQNLAAVTIKIPLDAGQRPKDLAHPGEIISRPISAATPLGMGYLVMDGIKSVASGNKNTYNDSFNNNAGVQSGTGRVTGGVSTTSVSGEGNTGTSGADPTDTSTSTNSSGGNSLGSIGSN